MPKIKNFETLRTIYNVPSQEIDSIQFSPGERLYNSRFEIVELLGIGGMGAVYRAKDHQINSQHVALKVLLPKLLGNPKAREMFINEVQISRQLGHPNIVRIFDLYEQDGLLFFTMEYICGPSLREWMGDNSERPLALVCKWMQQVCEGVEYAHQSTIHRDIKPDNILLAPVCEGPEFSLKISDFGLARLQSQSHLYTGSAVLGTLPYMAPELHVSPHSADSRVDIYALGVMLYELLTGCFPAGHFKLPSQIIPDLPAAVDDIITRALAQNPADRFSSAQALAQSLTQLSQPRDSDAAWQQDVADFIRQYDGRWSYREYGQLIAQLLAKMPNLREEQVADFLEHGRLTHLKHKQKTREQQNERIVQQLQHNLARVRACGVIQEFVAARQGQWDQTQWRNFLQKLREEGFYPLKEEDLLSAAEEEKQLYLQHYRQFLQEKEYIQTLHNSYRHQEALQLAAELREQGWQDTAFDELADKITVEWKSYRKNLQLAESCLEQQPVRAMSLLREALQIQPFSTEAKDKMELAQQHYKRETDRVDEAMKRVASLISTSKYVEAQQLLANIGQCSHRREEIARAMQFCHRQISSLRATVNSQRSQVEHPNLPTHLAISLYDDVKLELVLVPPGKFVRGIQEQAHLVTISRPFYVGIYPVTQEQWRAVLGEQTMVWKGEKRPVERVSWWQSYKFTKLLSQSTGRNFSLPTEAQWEYSCCCGKKRLYGYGDDIEQLPQYAWYEANSNRRTHDVGEKKANEWGIYDMHGQVWEWCLDWMAPYPRQAQTDPCRKTEGDKKVCRGGNAFSDATKCQSHFRFAVIPDSANSVIGLRVVLNL